MHHLRDNSGDRTFDKVDLTRKNKVKPHKQRTHSTAEHIMKMRFPNLDRYNENEQTVKQDFKNTNEEHREPVHYQKADKWVDQEIANEERVKYRDVGAADDSSDEEKKLKPRIRANTSSKKKVDTERLIKPTYSSLKRGRILPRDPTTNHTVSTLKATKVFSPNNPGQARKMLERTAFLNNLDDTNNDLNQGDVKSHHSGIFGETSANKTGGPKFVPNSKSPTHIKNASSFINSTNGFETFLRK